ncbi:NrsF family protein [Variovorax sp. M-6]|uniref:NrsF family protein n=1 Tax=Variovorax sp. M-6 TaxID=3233041 RepID=UPI003F9C398C
MRTEQLIAMLAEDAAPVPRRAVSGRLLVALAIGLPVSFVWMVMAYGVRSDLIQAMFWPMFWVRLLFGAGIALAGFAVVQRLARPGARVRGAWLGLAAPVLLIWVLALLVLLSAPVGERATLVWGQTWRSCAVDIAVVSLPVFGALLWGLKGLAPTRPALAGAAAGALAGGAGAMVYAFHCPELAAPFIATWYVAGIALPVVAGALIGPRLLRW